MISQPHLEQWRKLCKVRPAKIDKNYQDERDTLQKLAAKIEANLKKDKVVLFWDRWVQIAPEQPNYDYTLLVVTPKKITILELRNWSGYLSYENKKYSYDKDRFVFDDRIDFSKNLKWRWLMNNGNERIIDNYTDVLKTKVKNLEVFLEQNGISVPKGFIEAKFLLSNDSLNIERELLMDKMIIVHDKIDDFVEKLRGMPKKERFWQGVGETLTRKEKNSVISDGFYNAIPSKDFKALIKLIRPLRTWDKIGLHGGKIIRGKLDKIELDADFDIDLTQLKRGKRLNVRWNRNKLSGFFIAAIMRFSLGSIRYNNNVYKLNPLTDKVIFYQVGNKKPQTIHLTEIEWLENGFNKIRPKWYQRLWLFLRKRPIT